MRYGPIRNRDHMFAHDRAQSFAIGWAVIAFVVLILVGIFAA